MTTPTPPPVPPAGSSYSVVCPVCGWQGGKASASLAERYIHVAAKALKLAAVEGADPVDVVIAAANVECHADPALVRRRVQWLLTER